MSLRKFIRPLVDELESRGITESWIVYGGKHPKLTFHINGNEHRFPVSATPSDTRSAANDLAKFRNKLNKLRLGRLQATESESMQKETMNEPTPIHQNGSLEGNLR